MHDHYNRRLSSSSSVFRPLTLCEGSYSFDIVERKRLQLQTSYF